MSDFSADWLALREPADRAARSTTLTAELSATLSGARETTVLDLAGGTGSNVRYLSSRLPSPQRWRLVDHDRALLDEVPARMTSWLRAIGGDAVQHADGLDLRVADSTCRLTTGRVDLNTADHQRLVAGYGLVTASALLDLVSRRWLESLASACAASGAAVLFALTYDGRIECAPVEPEDALVRDLVNQHQQTDKGFGPALGPDAPAVMNACFAALGYLVRSAPSDWLVTSDQQELQRALLEGWANAAAEIAPDKAATVAEWSSRRLAHVNAMRSSLIVGHQDQAAWPSVPQD